VENTKQKFALFPFNWRRVILECLILASKGFTDKCLPFFSLGRSSRVECRFFGPISFGNDARFGRLGEENSQFTEI
jgi:hypothetical protein